MSRETFFGNRHIVLWGLFCTAFLLRGWGLADQPALGDEAAAASSAENYLRSGILGQVMWYHPHLRDIVVYLSGTVFGGYSAWGLRFGSVLLGSLTVPLLGYLAEALSGKRLAGYIAALFLCVDPLHIALSRQAFQESTTPFFIVAGVLAASIAIRMDRLVWCYLSGLLFGLAAAAKWHGLFPLAVSGVSFVFAPLLVRDYPGERNLGYRALTALAAFVALPLVIYTAVYLPWIGRGYSLAEFADFQVFLVQRQYLHHAEAYAETYLSQRAWHWFLWPVAWNDFVIAGGRPYLTIAMGNFLTWALTLPALGWCIMSWIRERRFTTGYAVLLFLVSYLPLVLTTRGIYVFSAPSVIPFAFLLSAWAIAAFREQRALPARALSVYLTLVLVLSALMYPMAIGRTLEHPYLKQVAERYNPHGRQDHGQR